MDPMTLTAEALRAGPIVAIIWLLLNRLERRFTSFAEGMDRRVGAMEAKLADGSLATRVDGLERRGAEDRSKADQDQRQCGERIRLIESQLVAVWQKIGNRPGDREAS